MIKKLWTLDRFNLVLLIILAAIFVKIAIFSSYNNKNEDISFFLDPSVVHVFYHPQCPHCHKEMDFLENMKIHYPKLEIKKHDITTPQKLELFNHVANSKNIPEHELGTPLLIAGQHFLVGYKSDKTTGVIIKQWIQELLEKTPVNKEGAISSVSQKQTVNIPVFGEIKLFETSLPILAITLGVVDGFNPCAMWVLVYLISLIAGLKDRGRILTLISIFILASGILYFLFMTAWLNAFLLVGYTQIITLIVGILALYMGITSIREFIASGGKVICELGNIQSRQKTTSKIRKLVSSPLNIATFFSIIALSFAVNSIEFICSSALPAIFTHVLTVADLPTLTYYIYILIYVFFFMLDDLIIFMFAAFAINRFAGEKYAVYCHFIGGIIMTVLGIMLTFFPEYLR